ncbi:MAG: ATPase, partial [Leptolyngbya sp. SIO1D8]|nr:ATPase [Leptolyngbya sp. SIO1D8]
FPKEPSVRYATVVGLSVRAATADEGYAAFNWLAQVAPAEWVQLFATDMFRVMRHKGQIGALATMVQKDEKLQKFLKEFQQLVGL